MPASIRSHARVADPEARNCIADITDVVEGITGQRGKKITPLAPGASVDQVINKLNEIIETLQGTKARTDVLALPSPARMQPGTVFMTMRDTPPPYSLKANGAAVSRTLYADLFRAIGTRFGAGDGSTTFNLPDLRGEFLRCWDDGRGVDAGRVLGSGQGHAVAYHGHELRSMQNGDYANIGTTGGLGGWGLAPAATNNQGLARLRAGSSSGATYNTEGSFAAETRPRNVALLACIAY